MTLQLSLHIFFQGTAAFVVFAVNAFMVGNEIKNAI